MKGGTKSYVQPKFIYILESSWAHTSTDSLVTVVTVGQTLISGFTIDLLTIDQSTMCHPLSDPCW